jgi:hypothetical protein
VQSAQELKAQEASFTTHPHPPSKKSVHMIILKPNIAKLMVRKLQKNRCNTAHKKHQYEINCSAKIRTEFITSLKIQIRHQFTITTHIGSYVSCVMFFMQSVQFYITHVCQDDMLGGG